MNPTVHNTSDVGSKKEKFSQDWLGKSKFEFGIRFKLLVIISCLLLVIVGSVTFILVKYETEGLRKNLQREANTFVTLATPPIGDTFVVFKDSGTARISDQIKYYENLSSIITSISIVDVGGNLLYSNVEKPPTVTEVEASDLQATVRYDNPRKDIESIVQPYVEASGAHRYSIVYEISSKQIEKQIISQTKIVGIFSLIALLLTVFATYITINSFFLRPIRKLSHQAGKISAGDLEQEIKVGGNDEIARLGNAVNAMTLSLKDDISKLKQLDATKSEFMIITSHNLRTPLTVIKGYTDSINDYKSIDEYKFAMEAIAVSAKRLDAFSEDILTISRLEMGDSDLSKEMVDLTKQMQDIAADFHLVAEHQQRSFEATIDTRERMVEISPSHIRSAIWNIFDNAIKFTSQGGKIDLRLDDDGEYAHITVSDNGIGIPQEELPKLFTKFHRATSLMTYDYEGVGIGLYASKLIIDLHGGSIDVSSTEHRGSTFTIKLPIVRKE